MLQKDKKKMFKSMEESWAALLGDLVWAGGCSIVGFTVILAEGGKEPVTVFPSKLIAAGFPVVIPYPGI